MGLEYACSFECGSGRRGNGNKPVGVCFGGTAVRNISASCSESLGK